MATFTVNNLNDNGVGSLRAAIDAANLTTATDSIVFQAGLKGNIALQNSLVLTNSIIINGDSSGDGDAEITLTDGGASKALLIVDSGVTSWNSLNISNSTVDFGASAIQVEANGQININYSVISNNTVLGVGNVGAQPSGIGFDGRVGAAILSFGGTITMYQSVLDRNSSRGQNGGNGLTPTSASMITDGGDGGDAATILTSGSLSIINSTMRNNSAFGGKGGNGGAQFLSTVITHAGNGGDGGDAASGVLKRFGSIGSVTGTLYSSNFSGTPGEGGFAGSGSGGTKGIEGSGSPNHLGLTSGFGTIYTGSQLDDRLEVYGSTKFFSLGGADVISGPIGAKIYGGAGKDTITSISGTGTYVNGGAGDDLIQMVNINTAIFGGTWNGGSGNDTFDASLQSVNISLTLNLATNANNLDGVVSNFENIIGTNKSILVDTLTGNGDANVIIGLAGTDKIVGGGGADKLLGDGRVLMTETANQIVRLYLATLGRGPDDAGLAHWTAQRDAGQSLNSIATGFVTSTEFTNKYGANISNSAFVTLLYNNVLDRAPDTAGLNSWVTALNGGASRESVVTGFSESAEFIRVSDSELHVGQVYRLYGATFGRQPDAAGFEGWVGALDDGVGVLEAARLFIESAEFISRYGDGLFNAGFVTQLYQNVLGRAPDTAGLNSWIARLNGGESRASVLLGFSDSVEHVNKTKAALNTFMQTVKVDWNDSIAGGSGNDNLGAGRGADVFFFSNADNSADHVYGFEAWDNVILSGFGFASPPLALAKLTTSGANVIFSDQGDTITFHQATLADVASANWFVT